MKIHLVIEARRVEGKPVGVTAVVEAVEDEIGAASWDVGGSVYDVRVLGVGRNPAELAESMKARRGR